MSAAGAANKQHETLRPRAITGTNARDHLGASSVIIVAHYRGYFITIGNLMSERKSRRIKPVREFEFEFEWIGVEGAKLELHESTPHPLPS